MAEAQFKAFHIGMPLKRPACTRCRQQKLRCLFESDNAHQCIRCSRAQVQCMAASTKQARRPARKKVVNRVTSLSRVSGAETFILESGVQAGTGPGLATNSLSPAANSDTAITRISKSPAKKLGSHNLNEPSGSIDSRANSGFEVQEEVAKNSFMKKFSDLNLSLHQHLGCINSDPASINLQTLATNIPEVNDSELSKLVSYILDSSNIFLDILKRYSKAVGSPETIQSTREQGPNMDRESILLILKCYTQILRIYNIIYFYVHIRFLSNPIRSPSIGLHIDGVSIQSGQLQLMVFTSVMLKNTYMMEKMLQIPSEFQFIENDVVDKGIGLFREENLMGVRELVAMVLRQEEVGKLWEGMGGMKALRTSIRGIKSLMAKTQAKGSAER